MSNRPIIYTVGKVTESARALYNKFTAGLNSPPSFNAFNGRIRKGERDIKKLCLPNMTLADSARKAASCRKLNGKAVNKSKSADLEPPISTTSKTSTHITFIETVTIKLVYGKPYYRPNSLMHWPHLADLGEVTDSANKS